MPSSLEKLKKNVSLILWLITIIGGGGSFTLFGGLDWVRKIAQAPAEIEMLKHEVEHIRNYQEMDWQFSRLMTDNLDTLDWFYANDDGEVFSVDIRHNAEQVPIAFVFRQHMPYPLYYSPADGKYYIIIHDESTHQNYYLYKR